MIVSLHSAPSSDDLYDFEMNSPLLAAAPTTRAIRKAVSGDDWQVTITNMGEKTALFVWLEPHRMAAGAYRSA